MKRCPASHPYLHPKTDNSSCSTEVGQAARQLGGSPICKVAGLRSWRFATACPCNFRTPNLRKSGGTPQVPARNTGASPFRGQDSREGAPLLSAGQVNPAGVLGRRFGVDLLRLLDNARHLAEVIQRVDRTLITYTLRARWTGKSSVTRSLMRRKKMCPLSQV